MEYGRDSNQVASKVLTNAHEYRLHPFATGEVILTAVTC